MRCTTSFENTLYGRKRYSRLLVASTDTQSQVQSLKEKVGMVSKQGQNQGRGRKLGNMVKLLLQHSWAEWPSFFKELRGDENPLVEGLYSSLTVKPLHNLCSEVSRLLEGCSVQSLSCGDRYRHSLGSAGKQ